MKHADRPRGSWLLRGQAAIAVALPLVVARFITPEDLLLSLAVITATALFAALHLNDGRAWLIPMSAVVSSTPVIPLWAAAIVAGAVGLYLVVDPIQARTSERAWPRWALAGVLLVASAGLATWLVLTDRAGDANFVTAQNESAELWDAPLMDAPEYTDAEPGIDVADSDLDEAAATGGITPEVGKRAKPLARMTFERPGSSQAPVTSSALFIEPSVSEADLTRGPGHYPGTAKPGKKGNFAVAGHRTGWGEPFADLDELMPGDLVTVEDRKGRAFTYEVQKSALVEPDDTWVLDPDPLGTGERMITLTTCDPPGVNTQRLIVWGALVD